MIEHANPDQPIHTKAYTHTHTQHNCSVLKTGLGQQKQCVLATLRETWQESSEPDLIEHKDESHPRGVPPRPPTTVILVVRSDMSYTMLPMLTSFHAAGSFFSAASFKTPRMRMSELALGRRVMSAARH